jgi:Ca2+/Na+ antiporter
MFNLFLIGLLIASFALSNTNPRKTAAFYFIMAFVVLFFKILPDAEPNIFDSVIMALLFIISGFLFVIAESTEKNRTTRTYIKSFKATFTNQNTESKI